jgi:predicted HAD superfamily Cof-like phosphohydrolase
MSQTFQDVYDFQVAMGLPMPPQPQLMDPELFSFRVKFMEEELREFVDAVAYGDLVKAVDAMLDLVYVAHGTAAFMGVNPMLHNALWKCVHEANMRKQRAVSVKHSLDSTGRGHQYDVVKPAGWVSPDSKMRLLIEAAGGKVLNVGT